MAKTSQDKFMVSLECSVLPALSRKLRTHCTRCLKLANKKTRVRNITKSPSAIEGMERVTIPSPTSDRVTLARQVDGMFQCYQLEVILPLIDGLGSLFLSVGVLHKTMTCSVEIPGYVINMLSRHNIAVKIGTYPCC